MTKKQHYMTYPERIRLEEKLRYKVPVAQIARELGFSRQTIYNEIKRGLYDCVEEIHGYYRDIRKYSADVGQAAQDRGSRNKGRGLKIGKDRAYADFLEARMLGVQEDGRVDPARRCSPAVALELARRAGFATTICVTTLYSYIDTGLFLHLDSSHLWEKPDRRPRPKDKELKKAHEKLPSIETRPRHINDRTEYGHWEMDLVVGPQNGSGHVLLTLTERKSRQELIFKLPDRRAATIRGVFDALERSAPDFYQRFKSISTDNGSEFLEYEQLIRSVLGGTRFEIYYCHSYAAWEKGSNENHNRMIRRWLPKGTDLSNVSKKRIAALQDWMNSYPRKILGWKSPQEMTA